MRSSMILATLPASSPSSVTVLDYSIYRKLEYFRCHHIGGALIELEPDDELPWGFLNASEDTFVLRCCPQAAVGL